MFDVRMRQASAGAVGVDNLMTALVSRFRDSTYTNDDVVRVAEGISGADLREAYAAHVAGRQRMPLERYLEGAGFRATVTPYVIEVTPDPHPNDIALRIRRAITRGASVSRAESGSATDTPPRR